MRLVHPSARLLGIAVALWGLAACAPAAAPSPATQPPAKPRAAATGEAPAAAATSAAPAVAAAPATTAPATAPQATLPRPLDPPRTVRVGVLASISDSGIYIGIERGYYRELGIDVQVEV